VAPYFSGTVRTAPYTSLASSSDAETSKSKLLVNCSCTIYLYAANDPVIEASSNLRFAPFNIGYPLLREHAQKA
jgi:hypothetical protein